MLLLFVVLSAVAGVVSSVSHPVLPAKAQPIPFLFAAFLAWRVSRGGRISYAILLLETALQCLGAMLAVARYWNFVVVGLVVISAVQIMLLVSPPVAARVERVPAPAIASGWTGLVALVRRPPAWLLACGVLIGVLVTLAYLGNMGPVAVPGCSPAASVACTGIMEGYPLRWLSATQSVPVIDKGALCKDCVQWALVSCSVLYAAWLWLRPRPRAITVS